jgi:hypothetical protein
MLLAELGCARGASAEDARAAVEAVADIARLQLQEK